MNPDGPRMQQSPEVMLPIDPEERKNLFLTTANKYEQSNVVVDSIVRKDQENDIAAALSSGPVMIRGASRIGKTSMCYALSGHFAEKPENTVMIGHVPADPGESLEQFKSRLGFGAICALPLFGGLEQEDQTEEMIAQSGKPPFEFLNDELVKKGDTLYVAIDEAISLVSKSPEKAKYLASLGKLSNIRLAVVMHQSKFEPQVQEIFDNFQSFYIRSLRKEEVAALVRKPLEGAPIQFTDAAVDRIFSVTGGRPMEVNNICRGMMYPHSEGSTQKAVYDAKDVDDWISQDMFDLKNSSLGIAVSTYQETYKNRLSERQQELTRRLVADGAIDLPENDEDAKVLEDLMIAKREESGKLVPNGEFFSRVIKEYILSQQQ